MKSKEKIILIITMLIVLIILYILYSIYINQTTSYATTTQNVEEIKISNAEKIEIEKYLQENQKENLEEIITEEVELEYITQYKNNSSLAKGTIQVLQEGRTGTQQITIKRKYDENGEIISEEQINSIIIKSAVNKIVEIGTSNTIKASKITKGTNIYVTSDRAEIMQENNTQSAKITTITKNTELTVIEEKDGWYKIKINGQEGWIKEENVTSVNPNPTTSQENNTSITKLSFEMALNKPSGLSLEQFKKVLTDSKDVNNIFSENAEYFYYIEQQYNINGIFVAAIGLHESAWGTSKIAQNKKNLFGYGAYDSSPYSSSYSFDTYAEGIDLIARVLVKYYLNPNGTSIYNGEVASGKYYNGNTLTAVNKKYATDKNWANSVYKYMEYLYKKI